MSQKDQLLSHLKKYGSLSNVDCMSKGYPVRTSRLAKYINDFRNDGMEIETKVIRLDGGQYIDTIYSLIQGKE